MISPHALKAKSWEYITFSGILILCTLFFSVLFSVRNLTTYESPKDEVNVFTGFYANGVNLPSTHYFLLDMYERYAYDLIMKTHSQIHSKHIRSNIFEDVHVNYPLSKYMMEIGNGEEKKAMILVPLMFSSRHKKCIVYGIGIKDNSEFEENMARYCEVHAFDCTISTDAPSVQGKPFVFHQQCIGGETFLSLNQTMAKLGHHKHIDILKFDIEGSEWQLLEELLHGTVRPRQILFQLHTFCGQPWFEQVAWLRTKDKSSVNALFVKLYHAGYRLISKDLNLGDLCCCEFSMLYVY